MKTEYNIESGFFIEDIKGKKLRMSKKYYSILYKAGDNCIALIIIIIILWLCSRRFLF